MRVLMLGPYPPPHGGVQVNLASIRDFLQARGIPCDVINLTRHRRPAGNGVYYPDSAWGVLRLLARLPCDVIHLHIGGGITTRLLALCLCICWTPGRRAVLTFHSGGYPSSPEGRRARRWSLRGWIFRRFDRVIAVNREIADLMLRYGVPPDKVRVLVPWSPPPDVAQAGLSGVLEAFYSRHSPVLLTVGLLEPEYDVALQIDVLALVRQQYPDAGLAIIGSGSLEEGLRRVILSKPYADHVLLCGDVPRPEVLAAIARCGVFLRTTLYDGDSLAVREALHFGAPVIATDNGMRPQGVVLVPPSNQGRLLKAIEGCLRMPPPRSSTGGNPPDRGCLEKVLDLYQELMESG